MLGILGVKKGLYIRYFRLLTYPTSVGVQSVSFVFYYFTHPSPPPTPCPLSAGKKSEQVGKQQGGPVTDMTHRAPQARKVPRTHEPCSPGRHGALVNSTCVVCLKRVEAEVGTTRPGLAPGVAPDASGAGRALGRGLVSGASHPSRQELRARALQDRKLGLILDLDLTLLRACTQEDLAVLPWPSPLPEYRPGPEAGPCTGPTFAHITVGTQVMQIVFRDGLATFLDTVAHRFVLGVYTMGTREYAHAIVRVVDPTGALFGDRIVARCDAPGVQVKSLQWAHHLGEEFTLVVDDNPKVWSPDTALVPVAPFKGWVVTKPRTVAVAAGEAHGASVVVPPPPPPPPSPSPTVATCLPAVRCKPDASIKAPVPVSTPVPLRVPVPPRGTWAQFVCEPTPVLASIGRVLQQAHAEFFKQYHQHQKDVVLAETLPPSPTAATNGSGSGSDSGSGSSNDADGFVGPWLLKAVVTPMPTAKVVLRQVMKRCLEGVRVLVVGRARTGVGATPAEPLVPHRPPPEMQEQLRALGGAVTTSPAHATIVVIMDRDMFIAASSDPCLLPAGATAVPVVTDAWVRACCTHYDVMPVPPTGRGTPSPRSPLLGIEI